jgi:hypothetical protein
MPMSRSRATWVACTLLFLVAAGCGVYSATSGRVEERLKYVAVPYLENNSAKPDLEIELTDAIIRALQQDNTLKVVGDADARVILQGKIVRYRVAPAFASASGQVDEQQVQILVELEMLVRDSGEKIFEKKRLTGTGNYVLNDPDSSEAKATEEAAQEIVRGVLALVVEDW